MRLGLDCRVLLILPHEADACSADRSSYGMATASGWARVLRGCVAEWSALGEFVELGLLEDTSAVPDTLGRAEARSLCQSAWMDQRRPRWRHRVDEVARERCFEELQDHYVSGQLDLAN